MSIAAPRLFLVDTFGMIFRAYYARSRASVQSLRTSAGLPTEAVYVFHNMLKVLLDEHDPTYVVAVWEGRGPTFREEIFPDYKANRDEVPDDLVEQLPYIRELLSAWRIAVVEEDGYEADDTIGRLAPQAAAHGIDVWVISSDKDLMQLVGDGVSFFNPVKSRLYGPGDVKAFLGVSPRHVPDYLALVGDAADNIPGAPGIGKVGAKRLIEAYGDVEAVIENAAEVRHKTYRRSLQGHAEQIRLSKRLASLATDGAVDLDLPAARLGEPDTNRLLDLYRKLEFHSFANSIEGGSQSAEIERDTATLEVPEDLDAWLAEQDGPVAVAVLGTQEPELGLSSERGGARRLPSQLLPCAKEFLERPPTELWIHDWKTAYHVLADSGVTLAPSSDDTMLMAFLIDSSRTNHSLPKTVERQLGAKWKADPAVAAAQTRLFRGKLGKQVEQLGLSALYRTVDLPLLPVLARMESRGIEVRRGILDGLSSQLGSDIARLGAQIHRLAGREFNIGSPKQLGQVLFKELGLPAPKKRGKSKAPSTASDVLASLAGSHEIAGKVLSWRKFSKLKNTYVDVLPSLVQDDGRIHTTFNPTGSATGRLSSLNPNLQNIPARTPLGREIRKAFAAADGWRFVAADYSQIELRVLAHLSADPTLVQAFRQGDDIHARTAAEVLGTSIDLVSSDDRSKAKAVNFGIIYGLSPFGLAKQLGITQASARKYINRYFQRYSAIRRFIDETVERTRETGFSLTLFGRRRPVTDIRSKNSIARRFAERIAVNSPVQGTAADLIKKAMVSTEAALAAQGLRARMLLQVHDEILLECPEEECEAVAELVKREMESVAELNVPLVADISSGPNWRDLEKQV